MLLYQPAARRSVLLCWVHPLLQLTPKKETVDTQPYKDYQRNFTLGALEDLGKGSHCWRHGIMITVWVLLGGTQAHLSRGPCSTTSEVVSELDSVV